MQLIIDANILFSILIKKSKTENLIFKSEVDLVAPEFIFQEFMKYKEIILIKTKRTEEDFQRLISILMRKIKTIPKEEIEQHIDYAHKICPDKNDVLYFALALKYKCPVWSNDFTLKRQSIITVYSTYDLLVLFGEI